MRPDAAVNAVDPIHEAFDAGEVPVPRGLVPFRSIPRMDCDQHKMSLRQMSGELLHRSARNGAVRVNISLRGTLAGEFLRLRSLGDRKAADEFIEQLLVSEDPDLVRFQDGAILVIGQGSERGHFSPDW